MEKVVVVTGSSSGIGLACAEQLAKAGYRVYGMSRRAVGAATFEHVVMDVDDEDSVRRAIATVMEREARIDAVVNNAGFGILGSIEDTSIDEARRQLETNFFGVLRVCRAVLPHMRAAGCGHIVNISSLGGIFGMPFSGIYSASKFAVEGMSEALRHEVRPFGVRVSLVEPGDIKSEFTTRRRMTEAAANGSAYGEGLRRALAAAADDEANAPSADIVADVVLRLLRSRRPRLRHTVGMLGQRIVALAKRILPYRLFEWAVGKAFQIGPEAAVLDAGDAGTSNV